MLSKFHYYTGVIFKAYTYGVGDAIVTGGRYDTLLGRFGKDAAAIGFMVLIDDLMEALYRQGIQTEVVCKKETLYYNKDNYVNKLKEAIDLRKEGVSVSMIFEGANKEN
jgi:ATP phosphoribosyltransferase regulatory subunit